MSEFSCVNAIDRLMLTCTEENGHMGDLNDHFDRFYEDGATAPRVMAISIHPFLTGVAHRIKYVGVVMWTGEEIFDWHVSRTAGG